MDYRNIAGIIPARSNLRPVADGMARPHVGGIAPTRADDTLPPAIPKLNLRIQLAHSTAAFATSSGWSISARWPADSMMLSFTFDLIPALNFRA